MSKNESLIPHAENAGFGEHDLSDLVAAANGGAQIRPPPANLRGEVLRLLGLRLLFLLFRLFRWLRLFRLLLLRLRLHFRLCRTLRRLRLRGLGG